MSLIFGIVNFDDNSVQPAEIDALANKVKWENFVVRTVVDGPVALGYCHHPQRDPKAAIFRDDELTVLVDARLYQTGTGEVALNSGAPAEAFARAYRIWGTTCADHFNGVFAVVVIDRKKGEAHLFRDHVGARPLVYRFAGNRLIFASHEFGLVQSGLVPTALSEEQLIRRLFRFNGHYVQTIFRDIYKVRPAHCVSCRPGKLRVTKYWRPEKIKKEPSLSFEGAATRLRQLLIAATTARLEPGPTGVHVSGGIDSTGVASILADYLPDKTQLTGYSWSPEQFDDPVEGVNEKEYIEAFCADKQVAIKYRKSNEYEHFANQLNPEFEQMAIEHPTMQTARADGITTLFSGWGGDEFVSLSLRGTVNHLVFRFKWLTLLKYVRAKGVKHTFWQLRSDVFPLLVPFGLLPVYKSGYFQWSKLRMLKPAFVVKHARLFLFHSRKNFMGFGNRTRLMLNLLEMDHLAERMDSWGLYAERYGFEYKYPLLDKALLEFWFTIPVEHTYHKFGSRELYREALRGILTERVRVRGGKEDTFVLAYHADDAKKGGERLLELFHGLTAQEHLPFFRVNSFLKQIRQSPTGNSIKELRKWGKLSFYLHYAILVKKYFPPGQHLTKIR